MDRRRFVLTSLAGAFAGPLAAAAQQAGKVPRIGFLSLTSPSDRPPLLAAFRQRLRELGWVEGQNIVIDYRYAEGRVDRLPNLAAELVRLKVDLIIASAGTQVARATVRYGAKVPTTPLSMRNKVCEQKAWNSLNQLVSLCDEGRRHFETKRFGGLEIDHQLELRRLLDG